MPDENRLAGLQTSQSVMIDDFNNVGFFDAFDRLRLFIVVDQHHPLAFRHNQPITIDHADDLAVFRHRIIAKPGPHRNVANIAD